MLFRSKNASVIFADEPTASLDNSNRQLVVSLLKDCANRGAAIILDEVSKTLFYVYRNKFLKNMGIFHRNKKFFLSMKKYRDVLS